MTYIMCINDGRIFKTQKECAEYYDIDHVLLNHVIAKRRKSTAGLVFCRCTVNDGLSPYARALELETIRKVELEERLNITWVKPVTTTNTIFKLETECD